MTQSTLLSISPIDGRYHEKTQALGKYFSEYALIFYRVKVEIEWFISLANNPDIDEVPTLSEEALAYLHELVDAFDCSQAERVKAYEATTNHDVKAVEYYLKACFKEHQTLAPYLEFIHFACTSEDINNLSYALMLKEAREHVMTPFIEKVLNALSELAHDTKSIAMLSRTHGQSASPTTLGKEINVFVQRLKPQVEHFSCSRIKGKINGAVGNFNAHNIAYPEVNWLKHSQDFVENQLGLSWNAHTTQIEPHDFIAELCHAMMRINTIMIDFCQDVWSYISLGYFKQRSVANEVGSSTMPHKVNPIDFENAEGNFGFANAILSYMAKTLPTSRWQRDLTDSTLLRNIGLGFAHTLVSLQSLLKGLSKLVADEQLITQDLNQHWEVITEAVQTVMRRYGVENAYEKLKSFSRGQDISQQSMTAFIKSLEIPQDAKARLLDLTPQTYTGLSMQLQELQ